MPLIIQVLLILIILTLAGGLIYSNIVLLRLLRQKQIIDKADSIFEVKDILDKKEDKTEVPAEVEIAQGW